MISNFTVTETKEKFICSSCNLITTVKRYMIYLDNTSYLPKDAPTLLKRARELLRVNSRVIIRDTRVLKKYIEFDTSIPDDASITDILLGYQAIGPVAEYDLIIERILPKADAIIQSIKLFNDEKYWSAHEHLESIWKNSQGDEKNLLNGIILIAAAFVHDEKNESEICISILSRALQKLNRAHGIYLSINIDKIKERISNIIESRHIERFVI